MSDPVKTASASGVPDCRRLLMKEIITRPIKTATPESAMNPTPAVMESGISRSQSAAMPPVSASGTPLKTSSESFTFLNVAKSSAKMSASESGTTICNRFEAEMSYSKVPPHVIQ